VFNVVRWKDEGEKLQQEVAAAEQLSRDLTKYESERSQAEMLAGELEMAVSDIVGDTHMAQRARLDQLQVDCSSRCHSSLMIVDEMANCACLSDYIALLCLLLMPAESTHFTDWRLF